MNEMGNFLETIYDLLFQPRAGMRSVVEQRTLWQAFGVVVGCTLLLGLSLLGGMQTGMGVFFAALLACEAVLNWLLFTAIWHLIAALCGADGSVRQFLKATGFAHILLALFVPVLFLIGAFAGGMAWLGVLALLCLFGWAVVLLLLALCEVYRIGKGKAALVLFAPLLLAAALGLVIFLSAGSYIFMLLQQSDALLSVPVF